MKTLQFADEAIQLAYWPLNRFLQVYQRRANLESSRNPSLSQSSGNGLNLNIMSFNIRRGTRKDGRNAWIHRRRLVKKVLNRYRPDVVGLQEALDFQVSEVSAMLPGYEMIGIGNLGGSNGLHNAIFYDTDQFSHSEEGTFWLSHTPDISGSRGWGNIIPRICTWTRLIEKRSHQPFYLYNTHLDHISPYARNKGAILLTQHIKARPFQDPFVLTGDFNAGERSATIRYLKGKVPLQVRLMVKNSNPVPLKDTFRERYPEKRHSGTFHGYGRYLFRFKFDYIFVSSSIEVIDAKIITLREEDRYPSDHFPVIARIELPSTERSFYDQPCSVKAVNY